MSSENDNPRMSRPLEIEQLTDPDWIAGRLRSALAVAKTERAAVGVIFGRKACAVALDGGSIALGAECAFRFPVGCIAKLFTATLLHEWITAERISVDAVVAALEGWQSVEILNGVTVRQLLEHSHGLDDSTIESAQLRRDGSLDVEALCAVLSASPPLAAPGRFYSYGNAGALLCAAILERAYGRSFPEILSTRLLDPLGIEAPIGAAAPSGSGGKGVCPASGVGLTVSITDLVRFMEYQLDACASVFADVDVAESGARATALPGWHSNERGIFLGWKYYGAGWFGHASEMSDSLMLMRLNPGLRVGVVVFSGSRSPAAVASAVFRSSLPSLVRMRMPQLHREWLIEDADAVRFAATYANRARAVTVSQMREGRLDLSLSDRERMRETSKASMLPADDQIFFLQPPAADLFPFVQFISANRAGFEYLWTGSQILKRVSNAAGIQRSIGRDWAADDSARTVR